jgi:hypothetical protein
MLHGNRQRQIGLDVATRADRGEYDSLPSRSLGLHLGTSTLCEAFTKPRGPGKHIARNPIRIPKSDPSGQA